MFTTTGLVTQYDGFVTLYDTKGPAHEIMALFTHRVMSLFFKHTNTSILWTFFWSEPLSTSLFYVYT